MTDQLRVLLEIGPKGKRIVAAAMDWPGLERWGRTEDEAVDRLLSYVPRYAPVAERVGLRAEFERGRHAARPGAHAGQHIDRLVGHCPRAVRHRGGPAHR